MKKYILSVCFLTVMCFVACGKNVVSEQELSTASSEPLSDTVQSMEETVSEEIEIPESYEVEPKVEAVEYDYECYLQGIYLTADGKDDKIFIEQIQYVFRSDTEDIKKYGLEDIDWSPGYHIVDDSEEIIELPINEETEFLVFNWGHEQELADNSVNHAIEGWCLIKDPMYLWKHMQDEYGDWLPNYPMFIIMDESGYVDQVVELPLA